MGQIKNIKLHIVTDIKVLDTESKLRKDGIPRKYNGKC